MFLLRKDPTFELQVLATGTHLAPSFGLTVREIVEDSLPIDAQVEMLLDADTATAISKSMGLGLISFAEVYARLMPDLLLVLGDRFEIFSAVSAAHISRIPVAHIHGGELTEGAFDDALRHAITKMSQLHFVAANPYRDRVIQLGEQPERVFNVGGLGVDAIAHSTLLDRIALEKSLGYSFGKKNLLITFHPATLSAGDAEVEMLELLAALTALQDTHLIFTLPNADTLGRALGQLVRDFVKQRPHAIACTSLGQLRYLSCLAHVDGVVGNSSSGLLEAPALRTGTINIGNRQRGRLMASSVINCAPERCAISTALAHLYTPEFQARLVNVEHPHGTPGASERIQQHLHRIDWATLSDKPFYDLPPIK
jgi:GDP/UDP-N,N'-diacetylbacillosamine 2-epimerase (hydrolysing)